MTKATTPAATVATSTEPKAKPKYLVQREKRQRFSFGNTWLNAVLAGVVTDQEKLIAHGVHVKAGTQSELAKLSFETLLKRVQDAIFAQEYVAPTDEPAEAPAETTGATAVEA